MGPIPWVSWCPAIAWWGRTAPSPAMEAVSRASAGSWRTRPRFDRAFSSHSRADAMTTASPVATRAAANPEAARLFRRLHEDGLLILANAWDAGSARLIESL